MRRIGLVICLLVALCANAIEYQPITYSGPSSDFRSTSAYVSTHQTTGFSAISADNFNTLNSEGGACYNPSPSGPRKGRPGGGSGGGGGAIGEYDIHSPVGDVPFILFAILLVAYAVYRTRKRVSE